MNDYLCQALSLQNKSEEYTLFFPLLNELRKSDKMLGLPSILSLFRNKLNKFNNTGFYSSNDVKLFFIAFLV